MALLIQPERRRRSPLRGRPLGPRGAASRHPRSRLGLALALAFAAGLFAGACFNPNQPACAFSCRDAGLCPDGYTCGADKFCHKLGATGLCPLDDAGVSSPDAAAQD